MKKLLNNPVYTNMKPIALALIAAGILSACGGGGGGSSTNTGGANTPPPTDTGGGNTPPPTDTGGGTPPPGGGSTPDTALTMSCVDGTEYQCSGGTVIKTDNGVMLTRSGVQVFGISTSDLALDTAVPPAPANSFVTNPRGFALPSASTALINGVAEVRVAKTATNEVNRVGLLLNDFGLSWDGKTTRPLIIETFETSAGRVVLNPTTQALVVEPLRAGTDVAFYDRQTQVNYANNTYRPTTAIKNNLLGALDGGWRIAGGTRGDWAETGREHEDGDLDAPTAPAAGTKGYRGFTNIAYEFANMTAWNSQDTVNIAEWTTEPRVEHNKKRRGIVAFGNVTSPAAVPTSGTATYTGTVYGFASSSDPAQVDPDPFEGRATVTVDYATGTATIAIQDTGRYVEVGGVGSVIPVPAAFTTTATKGAVENANAANYFTGAVNASGVTGGVSGRYFGADAKEVGGTFQLQGASGVTIVGGFIARKP